MDILTNYSYLLYPITLVWTFIEGETIVIIAGAIGSEGRFRVNVELLALSAFTGSFLGDQLYYYIGRRYGPPILKRWHHIGRKTDWAFRLVETNPVVFILSFRFIYGIRNISPFVIGIAGVPRLKYFVLNFIAAMIWAHSFAWGGYFIGSALNEFIGDSKWWFLGGFVLVVCVLAVISRFRRRKEPD
ncbi:MAG: hypothetical protein A3G18_04425 [Rhodospirillales bacterium RIFCSPLOWO2_12_FULL_58_28]|nr:MAG: hypothetical protein A3H92_09780 [Rhodospirillales bacterium RIFCSPLOWO2_02_FULL_58_16]OHC76956.1 MAG: hypothetical protein A3G18_04425 [Rhodospirillales bacterium RIFCSPLOWO2_12_FULL_58_28]